MTKPADPIAEMRIQAVLAKGDASLAQLEEAKVELDHVLAGAAAEREEIAARRTIEMNALMPAAALDKALDRLDLLEKAVARRVEIASTVRPALTARIDEARGVEVEAARQARYDAALALHVEATGRVREFLNRAAPEARAVMATYLESEAATFAANRNLPAGCLPIRSIEAARQGNLPAPKVTVRKYQVFLNGREPVGEVGRCEAHPNSNGIWSVYFPSRSIQGDTIVPNCVVEDRVEIITEKYEPVRLEALGSALRVPPFSAPPPTLGRPERKTMPLSEWLRLNGDAEQVPLQVAAE
jgi:hypothetical protein